MAMFESIKNLWKRDSVIPSRRPLSDLPPEQRLATAVLLLEVIRADLRVTGAELEVVATSICRACDLSEEEASALLREAEAKRSEKDALGGAARVINSSFSREQKQYLLELLWTVALSDERLERHEDNLVRKLTKMLSMNHLDLVDAKLKAEAVLKGGLETS
jgi:uncharacterized tellurite resistance protein B-like protein